MFDASGVCWSELLCLPYFDAVNFVVVNAMHNLFLGMIKEHLYQVLGFMVKEQNIQS